MDQKIVPQINKTESGRVGRLERFSHYVARQIGFEDPNECPQLCKLANDYLKKTEGSDRNIFDFIANESDAESLYVDFIEEIDRCILSYFSFHWSQTSLMINQVLSKEDVERKTKLKDLVMAATRKQRFDRVLKNLKVARVFLTLVDEMKAIGETNCTEVMVPMAHNKRSPVLLLMGGGMGAGKSTVLKDILKEPFWSGAAASAVVVEADAFKETDVHQSSTDAASSLLVTALNEGRDVIMDGTLSWAPFVEQTLEMARNVHKWQYRMGIGYKTAEDGTTIENYWERVGDEDPDEISEQEKDRKPYRIELVGVLIGWKDGHSKLLVDVEEIKCLSILSELNDEAESIYELHNDQSPLTHSGSVWKELVMSNSRPNIQMNLKSAILKYCNKGPGARLTHVTAKHVNVSDIISPTRVPTIVGKLFDLGEEYINYDGHTKPLLSIQVTELVDGIFIGFTANHCVVDGISFMHFLSMLSEIFCSKSSKISRLPVYVHGCPAIKLPYLGLKEVMTTRKETNLVTDRVFFFSSKSVALIKAKANSDGRIPNVSSFQSLVSFIWKSITRGRNQSSDDQEIVCNVAISTRTRVHPPLSNDYIGNYVMHVKVICKVGELLSHDLGWVANLLNNAIRAKDSNSVDDDLSMIAHLITTPGFLCSTKNVDIHNVPVSNNIVIGGSARFNMYGLGFGLGKPIAIRMGPGNKPDGKVNASQGCEEGGSVKLEISLKEEHMSALEADHDFMTFVS
ncbi:hypothetical protein KSS87_008877 [Heliosperma pusillum]|nr:hypothetical protein KSS87_008877 [Heliosperma pusillum]